VEDDARSDWLDTAKTHVQGIRASVGASMLLSFLIGLMIWGQWNQLIEDEQKEWYTACFLTSLPPYLTPQMSFSRRINACPPEDLLHQLQGIYEGFPYQQMEANLIAWNKFAWSATQGATFVNGSKRINREAQDKGQPPFVQIPHGQSSVRAITTIQLHLRTYTENFKVIEDAAKSGISFTDLTVDKLVALMLVYQFEFGNIDVMGQNLAQSLATPAFEQGLAQLQQATASATGQAVADEGDLGTGASLSPVVTLRNELKRSDPAGYYGPLQSADMSKLISSMQDTHLVTIGANRNEDARLKKQMWEIREGTTDSAINIPLLNLPLTLSAFSRVSRVLNVVLLLWLYWHIHQMDFALKGYRACAPNGRSRMEAALWGLPGLGRWSLPIRLVLAFCLSTPVLLGTYIRSILWWIDPDQGIQPPTPILAFPSIVLIFSCFLFSCFLVYEVQRRKSSALSCVWAKE
jgi:hypothetical protein